MCFTSSAGHLIKNIICRSSVPQNAFDISSGSYLAITENGRPEICQLDATAVHKYSHTTLRRRSADGRVRPDD
jgi:hypothetical protein